MNERTHAPAQDTETERRKLDAPGRRSASSELQSCSTPMASGILMRKGSGGETSDEANGHVDRAMSSGGGRGLPDDLRGRFEGSLGTDLSSVRVHDSAESQTAASAVAAKAFTVGNDIHFASGQYDPGTPSGQHLIAHEVAHTVQQRGGTPVRQNKLEVSHAGDSFEIAADRAADAMVVGTRTTIGGASFGIARKEHPLGDLTNSVSISKGPVQLQVTTAASGKVTITGGITLSGNTPSIWGIFIRGEVSASTTAEGTVAADGSATIEGTGELTGQVTVNGGIQNVASAYGGGAITAKVGGISVKRSASGAWSVDVKKTIPLIGKALVGIQAQVPGNLKDALPKGWTPELKYEVNPGGDVELAIFNLATGKFTAGKDLASIVGKFNAALSAAGITKGQAIKKLESNGTQQYIQQAKALEDKVRAEQNAKDRKEYDKAHNPKAQKSGGEVDEIDELDSCEAP